MSVAEQERKKPDAKPQEPGRFVQLTAGLPYGQGLTLFALDDQGEIWQMIIGRTPWELVPRNGLLESH